MVFGRPIPTAEIVEKIDAVDADAVMGIARRLFQGTPTLAALGPVDNISGYSELSARLSK